MIHGEFVAGGIRHHLDEWKKLSRDKVLLNVVQGCPIDFTNSPPSNISVKSYPVSDQLSQKIDDEINSMLSKGILRKAAFEHSMFLSPIFVRTKKSGALRLILNLKEFNEHIPFKHFKMEMFENVIKLITPGMWMCSLDIKDAYYSIPIHPDHQKYFSFEWHGQLYSYTVMPNGWGNAPYVFTKLMKPVFQHLREQGYLNSYFIDDSLLMDESYRACEQNCNATEELLIRLGFVLNEKSIKTPTQNILHLGNIIDTVSMTVYLPQDKKTKIKELCTELINLDRATIRFVAKVIGTIISTHSAVEFGKLYYRTLELNKIDALKTEKGNFDSRMPITDDMKSELSWWINNVDTQVRLIHRPPPTLTLLTDSSMLGWGCVMGEEIFNGQWTLAEQEEHINVLDMKAILLSLQAIVDTIKHQHVRVASDSTTAVTYINKMGGIKSQKCNNLSKEIWELCIAHNTWLSCQHIPGKDNAADAPSRKVNDDIEWQITEYIFNEICKIWGTPSIDLFASRNNHKVIPYCSWKRDPKAAFIDAFTLSWYQFELPYMFPPFSMIPRCLQKLQQDQAEAIMILPLWPQQAWFPNMLRTLTDHPIVLPNTANILYLAHSRAAHPLSPKLKLIACRLSGNNGKSRGFQRKLSISSWNPGGQQPEHSTRRTYRSGSTFALNGTAIPFFHL